ncbi:MAG TPA: undecaprenyldiphospho-muramoylpentapeptide beta-N-acetylglucosaminyltransferase [Thermoanaerobaculia bacterium]|nr:undecaprenyldiphospho-muramoylpentapeptide beta-N-acetylglucosaminyltransferase [Thermoanaerobaculia bacterium]
MDEPSGDLSHLHVALAGGGSGGHVFPALAVAEELRRRGCAVSFLGSPHGFEARLVPERGIDFHPLPARPVVGRGPWGKARAGWTLLGSTWRARRLLRRLDARVVLGTGGYVSVAPVLGARLAGVPVVLLEPNAAPGAANRTLSRWAAGACLAFAAAERRLRCPGWVTGVPVREAFFAVPRQLPGGGRRLLVLGGSQGALQLDRLLPAALAAVVEQIAPLAVLHQCGTAHVEATREAYAAHSLPGVEVEVVPFLERVDQAMAASHLVVSRAGAITLAELCAAGRGSLLVPLALAEAHQARNAEAMEAAGAARLIPTAEATAQQLGSLLAELVPDRGRLQAMADAARALARPNAAAAIVERLREVAG